MKVLPIPGDPRLQSRRAAAMIRAGRYVEGYRLLHRVKKYGKKTFAMRVKITPKELLDKMNNISFF